MKNKKRKRSTLAVLAALAVTCPGVVMASPSADAQATDVAQMREEIASLTARLNTLEKQLQEKESKDKKAMKAEKSKAPTLKWSGSTKNGYMKDENHKATVKSEIRLKANTKVDDTYDVAFGLKFKSTSEETTPAQGNPRDPKNYKDGHSVEKNKVKLDAASIGRAFGPARAA